MDTNVVLRIMAWETETGEKYPRCEVCKVLYHEMVDANKHYCEYCWGKPIPVCELCGEWRSAYVMGGHYICPPCVQKRVA